MSKEKKMTSRKLAEARRYEEEAQHKIPEDRRPAFHLSTRAGWMNDPNGFSFYDGKYHLFYQYYPYDPHWGPMHWGHAVSEDLLHWEYLPAAMAPDMPYDQDGCFSGSAITLPDGRHLLMYTGVAASEGSSQKLQTQCLAFGNGIDYEKYEGNPVLTGADLPEGGSDIDFRDPRIWQVPDGTYRCALGNLASEGGGQILLFESPDAVRWTYKKVLASNRGRFGRMWECPDFFRLDDTWVLLVSPQDMLPEGFEYHNGNGTLCLTGTWDEETETFIEEKDQAIDYGIDFYAPQTILTPDGRRVMIGWMQNWDTCDLHMEQRIWCGQMSLPRELSVRNGRLYQQPVREIETLRHDEVRYERVLLEGVRMLEGIRGRQVEMMLEVTPAEGKPYQRFSLRFAQNETYHTNISYRPGEQTLKIDRKFSGSRRAIIHQRRAKIRTPEGVLRLHVILDRCSVEVFVNDGEQVMTATLYTDPSADGISFSCEGSAWMNVTMWDLS